MRIAVTSQNFRSVTGHAGKARRFIFFEADDHGGLFETARVELPPEMAMHGFDDRQPHPLDGCAILITGGAGDGFVARMARRGIRVLRTAETDILEAVRACRSGTLKPPAAHAYEHDADGETHACGCGH